MTKLVAPARQLELDDLLPEYRFHERHRRRVDRPVEQVWAAALAVSPREVRAFAPLMALRELPARLRRRPSPTTTAGPTMLELLQGEGFLAARRDDAPVDGRALVLLCAAGRFWSPTGGAAVPLADVEAFRTCRMPKVARAAATLEVVDRGGWTELITETRVAGTDRAANRAFAAYWALIRLPSGLIRRSWLAAVARRAG